MFAVMRLSAKTLVSIITANKALGCKRNGIFNQVLLPGEGVRAIYALSALCIGFKEHNDSKYFVHSGEKRSEL